MKHTKLFSFFCPFELRPNQPVIVRTQILTSYLAFRCGFDRKAMPYRNGAHASNPLRNHPLSYPKLFCKFNLANARFLEIILNIHTKIIAMLFFIVNSIAIFSAIDL